MSERELIKRTIELCLAAYRVAEKFPAGEILRERIKNASLDVLDGIINDSGVPTERGRFFIFQKIKNLLAYFDVAEPRGFVDVRNFWVLKSAYKALYHSIAKWENTRAEAPKDKRVKR